MYNAESVDGNGALIVDKSMTRWMQTLMESHNIVLRAQTGKM